MIWLRSFARLLLVLAVLPWGAYSGAMAAQSAPPQDAGFADAGPVSAGVAVTGGDLRDGMAFAPKPKRCRTAVLLGTPCGPDLALPGSALSPDLTDVANAVLPADGSRLAGVKPAGSLDPPRAC
ncbi:hypothetical protein EYC08_00185 [Tabrizicola sp. WMC-M-20]|nr:hypothetical protein EYC08_00185 [Tabrizicola sp. WMC-M-20]